MSKRFGFRHSGGVRRNNGFSLIEILVSLTIFSVMILVAGGVLHKVLIDWGKQRDYIDCIQNGRTAMAFMVNELRNAKAASVHDQNGKTALNFLWPGYTAPSDQVWYWVGNQDDDATQRGDRTMLYRGIGSNINNAYDTRKELANFVAPNPGGEDEFDYSNNVVTITLTFMPDPEEDEGPGNRAFTLRAQVRPRN
jgi:prepilin-type N-terminal cleavage/methylation domain-containing protein